MTPKLQDARRRRVNTICRRTLRRELRQSPLKRWVWAELNRHYEANLSRLLDEAVFGGMSGPFAEGLRRHG